MCTRSITYSVDHWVTHECADLCEHVQSDPKVAHAVLCEDGSMGPMVRKVVCDPCLEAHLDEKCFWPCNDCGTKGTWREMSEWRWWEFCVEAGDEALYICKECLEKPTHRNRVAKDTAARDKWERDAAEAAEEERWWTLNALSDEEQMELDEQEDRMAEDAQERYIRRCEESLERYYDGG